MKWKLFLFYLDLWLGLYVNWIQGTATKDLVFYDSQKAPIETVEAKENDTVVLSCSSKSSKKLELSCDRGIKHKTFKDTPSKVEITADRLSHGKKCSCQDLTHSTEEHIRLNITYHAEISDFYLMRGAAAVDNKPQSENVRFKLKCEATGNPSPLLQLSHQNESHVVNIINYTTGHTLEYNGTASCDLAGLYTCVVSNKLNTVNSSREMILQVKCATRLCESSKDLVYRVPLMKMSQIQICVLHFIDGLYDVQIHKHVNNNVNQVHYPITFTYTTPTRLRGDFTLSLNLTTQNDFGNYFLQIQEKPLTPYKINFTLRQQETPQCPTNLSIIPEGKNFLLSWMDGDDGGSKQTFVVLQAVSKEFTEVGKINDTLGNITTYKVAGLEQNTTYIFSVNVYNNMGTLNCSNLTVSISTPADSGRYEESTQKEDNIIIIIIVCIILGIFVVVPVICFARRHHIKTYGSGEIEKSKLEMKETPNDLYDFDPALPPDSNVKNLSNEESVSKLVEVEREKKALISTNNDTKTSNSTEQNVYGNMDENKPRHNSMDTSGALIQVL